MEPRELSRKLMTLEDLVRLIFKELNPSLFDYLRVKYKENFGDKFIGHFLVWYSLYYRTDMLEWLSVGIGEPDY